MSYELKILVFLNLFGLIYIGYMLENGFGEIMLRINDIKEKLDDINSERTTDNLDNHF